MRVKVISFSDMSGETLNVYSQFRLEGGFGGSFLGYGGANESSLGRVAYNHYNTVLLQVHFIY